jgi:hypothetical protein
MRKTVSGRILLVQEERFRLATDSGQDYLLDLAHNANVGAPDLHRLHQQRRHVMVEYEGTPNLVSGVAHKVTMD